MVEVKPEELEGLTVEVVSADSDELVIKLPNGKLVSITTECDCECECYDDDEYCDCYSKLSYEVIE